MIYHTGFKHDLPTYKNQFFRPKSSPDKYEASDTKTMSETQPGGASSDTSAKTEIKLEIAQVGPSEPARTSLSLLQVTLRIKPRGERKMLLNKHKPFFTFSDYGNHFIPSGLPRLDFCDKTGEEAFTFPLDFFYEDQLKRRLEFQHRDPSDFQPLLHDEWNTIRYEIKEPFQRTEIGVSKTADLRGGHYQLKLGPRVMYLGKSGEQVGFQMEDIPLEVVKTVEGSIINLIR